MMDTHASKVWQAYCYWHDNGQDNRAANIAAELYGVRVIDILDERDSLKDN